MSASAALRKNIVQKPQRQVLSWALVGVYVAWTFGLKILAVHLLPLVAVNLAEQLLLTAFFVAHGLGYYTGKEVAFYAIACAVVSNVFENLSVLYGFPFGYYHHTALAGPKLFNVPYVVTLIYLGLGYVSWMVAQVIARRTNYCSWRRMVYLAPLITAFVFTSWDFCIDPIYGTIYKVFIYRNPGVWFGTPGGNYFGWLLMTYLFYLLFALFLKSRAGLAEARPEPGASYWLQPVLIYITVAIGIILANVNGKSVDVTVEGGKIWNSGDIYGASTLATVFTMVFISLLASIALYQHSDFRQS
jgi:putative membrane protein